MAVSVIIASLRCYPLFVSLWFDETKIGRNINVLRTDFSTHVRLCLRLRHAGLSEVLSIQGNEQALAG